MADLDSPLSAVRDDAVTAFNTIADVIDFLDVVDMALSFDDNAPEVFSQITTVLGQARKIAIEGREAASRATNALEKEIRI